MLCSTCSAEIPDGSAFCPKCGQRLAGSPAGATPSPAVAATPTERMRAAGPAAVHPPEPEHDLWRGSYSPKAMYGNWVLAFVLTVAALVLAVLVPNPAAWIAAAVVIPVIWLGLLLMLVIRRLSIEYTLTTQRFLHKKGLLRRVADQILLVDIDDVSYEQGLVERMFGVGKITLRSNDPSDPTLRLVPIDNVQQVANLIDEARREERRKRAIYMANA